MSYLPLCRSVRSCSAVLRHFGPPWRYLQFVCPMSPLWGSLWAPSVASSYLTWGDGLMDQLKLSSFTACCKSVSYILTSLGHCLHRNETHYTDNVGSFSATIIKLHSFQGTGCFLVIVFILPPKRRILKGCKSTVDYNALVFVSWQR